MEKYVYNKCYKHTSENNVKGAYINWKKEAMHGLRDGEEPKPWT